MTQRAVTGATGAELLEHTGPGHRTEPQQPVASPSATTRRILGLDEAVEQSLTRTTVDGALQRVGGPVGLASAAAPTIAFVVADAAAGLVPALIALLVTAVAACVVRLVRRESPGAAAAGLLVAAVCAGVAAVTGQARGFFLPAMVVPVLFVLAYTASLLARRPLMGFVVNPLAGGPRTWRTHRPLRRLYTASTVVGLGLAGLTLAARVVFYLADQPAALAVVQVASTTSFALHFAATVVLARRSAGGPVDAGAAR
ncbi:hypothetical protein FHR75_004092 [Kineococcus radiotolerans]|uniref:Integral membrane protein n=1 Tax=Kineococcus radiotolerans TaxID=131568 RepID=A0A7W4TQT2_KINRA|nr:DUF3159 domain-containing protein [Kineococcus radiotolerans]MBB2903250.1 hypothetical protein [Kineococcus radiotolerans]